MIEERESRYVICYHETEREGADDGKRDGDSGELKVSDMTDEHGGDRVGAEVAYYGEGYRSTDPP